jgi:hypothetical protein
MLTHISGTTNCLPSLYYILRIWYGTDRTENTVSNSSFIIASVFVAEGMCLLGCCLLTAIPSGSIIQAFMRWWAQRHTESKVISWAYFHFFENKEGMLKQEVLGRTNRLLSLIRHRPHGKWRIQQFFYCCVYIRYRGNVFTESLPSNDRGIFT